MDSMLTLVHTNVYLTTFTVTLSNGGDANLELVDNFCYLGDC